MTDQLSSEPASIAKFSHQQSLLKRFKRLSPYFFTQKGAWVLAILATAIAAATEPLIPAAFKLLLDRGFQKGAIEIWQVPATILAIFAIRGAAGYITELVLTNITATGLKKLRQQMFDKLLTAKLDLFKNQSGSELANTVVYEVQNGSMLLVNSIISFVRDSVTLIALVGYLLYLNWKLTLVVAIIFPGVALVMVVLTKRLYKLSKSSQVATDELAYVVEENVLAHRDVRLHHAQEQQAERFFHISQQLKSLSIKTTSASAAMKPATQMMAAIALSAVISIALFQSNTSGTTVGAFTSFVMTMLLVVAPIKHLSEIANPITRGLAAIERGFDLLDQTPSETSGGFNTNRSSGHIEIKDITVQFSPKLEPAVNQLSITIQPGETIALVGASGSGKTTLVNLLPRFIEANSGVIQLDGVDIKDWNLDNLRQQFAMVSQHVYMLNASLAHNVALGQNLDQDKVWECLKAANLEDFVSELPLGIHTLVGHNANQLSGGQRQRLAIARALYKNAPILILDEATSALDTQSERAVQSALTVLMKNRTSLVIAHRLSTVEHADRIVVMEAGSIIEIGSHTELINHNGAYAQLYRLGLGDSHAVG